MDEFTVELILGVFGSIMTAIAAYLQSKKKEAYNQGDVIMDGMEKAILVAQAFAVYVPEVQSISDKMVMMISEFQRGWDNAEFSTDDMMKLKAEFEDLANELKVAIATYAKR